MKELRKIVEATFRKHKLNYDYDIVSDRMVSVIVEWGDWKHDHIALDNIMKQNHLYLIKDIETETDGSDCYSSIHCYVHIVS